jgi:hypothetical protein
MGWPATPNRDWGGRHTPGSRVRHLGDKRIITGQCCRREGQRRTPESSILFSFETDFTGRVKAGPQIETWQGRSAAAFTPAVILFIALPEAKDNIDPG